MFRIRMDFNIPRILINRFAGPRIPRLIFPRDTLIPHNAMITVSRELFAGCRRIAHIAARDA